MQSPKPSTGLPSQHGDDSRPRERSAFDECRSFAPADARGLGEFEARWPAAWEALEADAFIQVHTPKAEPEVAGDPRRALIVIPALNEAAVIAKVIDQVLADDGLVDPLVVVADGGSTDGTREIVSRIADRDPRVKLMANPGRLQSCGMNLAARRMAGDRPWIVRVDAHADYPPNYASALIEEARSIGAHSVVVSMDTRGEGWFQRAVAAAQNSVLGTGGSAHRLASQGQWVDHGHHALFHADSFDKIGGYDESFSHNEDAELDYRLGLAGGRIWLTDKVRIGYHPRSTPQALWKQYFSYGQGRARTTLKHFTPLKVRQAAPLAIAPAVAMTLLAPFFWAFALPALMWVLAALSLGLVVGARERDPAAFASGPAAMIMHLAWSAGFWAQLATWRPPRGPGDGLLSQQAAA